MRTSAGFFMPKNQRFNIKPQEYQYLLNKLISRGLIISTPETAINHLKNIGYYRLIGYGLSFEQYAEDKSRIGKYKNNTQFDDIINTYFTDSKIRLILLSAIETIEVSVRNIINHQMACKYDNSHWYTNKELFKQNKFFSHQSFLDEIEKSTTTNSKSKREIFISHYYNHYDAPKMPPCWMIAEILSLGTWSKVYSNLKESSDRKLISRELEMAPNTLQSWLHAITYLRNLCAHHARLHGKIFVVKPSHIKNLPLADENRLFNYVCIIHKILKIISPESDWINRLNNELKNLPTGQLEQYGFREYECREIWAKIS